MVIMELLMVQQGAIEGRGMCQQLIRVSYGGFVLSQEISSNKLVVHEGLWHV